MTRARERSRCARWTGGGPAGPCRGCWRRLRPPPSSSAAASPEKPRGPVAQQSNHRTRLLIFPGLSSGSMALPVRLLPHLVPALAALLAVALALPAQGGTAAAPEVADPAGDAQLPQ